MKVIDYKIRGMQYILAYYRQNKDVATIVKIIGERFNLIQNVLLYLLNSYNIRSARGIWLDYAGEELGAKRDEVDFGNYFTVNRPHINTEKMFYFLSSGFDPKSPLSLNDAEFIQKIFAYIGTNSSSGTLEELLDIVKTITNAKNVKIYRAEPYGISLALEGASLILTLNTINYIQNILSNGIYLKEITRNA